MSDITINIDVFPLFHLRKSMQNAILINIGLLNFFIRAMLTEKDTVSFLFLTPGGTMDRKGEGPKSYRDKNSKLHLLALHHPRASERMQFESDRQMIFQMPSCFPLAPL